MKKKNKKEQEEDTSLHKADDTETWQEDPQVPFPDDEKSEVIKLPVRGTIDGKLVDVVASTSWKGRNIYKIDDGSGILKVILGTVMLDRQMSSKRVGDWVKIERLQDKPTDKGNPFQQYRTYSRKA